MKKILSVIIASVSGILILLGYFFKDRSGGLLVLLINWGILLISVAGLIGVGYLLQMHIRRLIQRKKGMFLSILLLLSFLTTLTLGFVFSLESEFFRELILNIQVPVEASLLALLAVVLFSSSTRLIKVRGWTPLSIGFLCSALVFLFLDLDLLKTGSGTLAAELILLIRRLPLAGARGILLGMALGGLIVGLRVLLGMDRPFGEGK